MIELQNVSKVFHTASDDVEAVQEVSLKIEDGDVFGIIGLSGAGKSTLVRCLNFLERPTSGSVLLDGVDLASLSPRQLLETRRSISMIFQGFNLLSQRTALRNVMYPLEIAGVPRRAAREKAMGLLETVGLGDRAGAYPSQLSGGMQQRVAIARALATDPKVLLCDEATSALDPATTSSILELLRDINQSMGVTIVVITHEMRVVERICNRVAVLDGGRLVETGPVSEVFRSPKSRMARQLILPAPDRVERNIGKDVIRLVFDGRSAFEPVISSLSLECRAAVNILAANTRVIEDRSYGQMLLQLPADPEAAGRVKSYLAARNISFEEATVDEHIAAI